MSTDGYFMESEEEAKRLDLKTDPTVVDRHARWAGLQPGMRVACLLYTSDAADDSIRV